LRIPELLLPLVAKGIVDPERAQVLTFWHDTMLFIFPPSARVTVTYRPRTGYVYLVFGMTMGKVRDYDTGDVLTTDDYGFWHRHSQMRWHWDPGVESVPAYSPVIVKYGSRGPIDVLPIEELFEKLPGRIFFDGKHEVKEVEEEVYTFNYGKVYKRGTRRWTRIKKVFRHRYKGSLIRVFTRGGMVDTSPNHSLILANGMTIDAKKVKPGDRLAMPNLSELCFNRDWNNTFVGSLDLAWLYGFYTAEGGNWRGATPKALLSNSDPELIERAKRIYEENFHRKATLTRRGRDGLYQLQMTGKWVAEFFRENFYTMHGHKKVPSFILNSAKEVRRAFLAGFYAGDGLKNPKRGTQRFATDSQTLAQGIMMLQHSLDGNSFGVYDKKDYPNSLTIHIYRGIGNRIPRGKVRKVLKIPYEGWVYDIEAENPHTFTTGIGPIKVRNSIYEFEYPHWLEVTEDDPVELTFYNNTGLKVIQDFSIWLFECGEEHWPIVRDYLRGVYNLFHILGQVKKPTILRAVERMGE